MKQLPNALKGIGILEIIGGIIGVGTIVMAFSKMGTMSAPVYAIFAAATGLFLYSIAAGILLLTNVPKGIYHTRINQWMQLIKFMLAGYGYEYASGIGFFLGVDITRSVQITIGLNVSQFNLNIATSRDDAYLSVNLVAIFAIYLIERYVSRNKTEQHAI